MADADPWAVVKTEPAAAPPPAAAAASASDPWAVTHVEPAQARQMPQVGALPGQLFINSTIAPKVPAGAPRPFAPGEYVQNPDGSWSSEITGTIESGDHPELNGGKATIVPTLWLVDGKPVRVNEDTAAAYAVKSGLAFPTFQSNAEAEAFSQKRESSWQSLNPQTANTVQALWNIARPESTPAPADPHKGFPFDEPGYSYGGVLPVRGVLDPATGAYKPGTVGFAAPEFIRAPVRGMITGGERLMGKHPELIGQPATPDETAAAVVLAGLLGGGVTGKAPPPEVPPLPKAQQAAVTKLASRIAQDAKAGGTNIADIFDEVIKGRATGKPLTIADVGGKNVQGLAGSVARTPGPAREFVENSVREQLVGAADRLTADVDKYISGAPSVRQSIDSMSADQRTVAKPLYEKAFEPGSVAPLEKQFEHAFRDTSSARSDAERELAQAQTRLTAATAKVHRAGDDVYAFSAGAREQRAAQQDVAAAEAKLKTATEDHDKTLARLREAQDAVARGERGGIWSPRVQEFLDDPILKRGITRGLEIQRLEALAEGKKFNPTDYSIVGTDPAGDPIVAKTPNMRLLDAGKRGLDAILEEYRDEKTGRLVLDERGRAIEMVRKAYVAELDRLNDTYAGARSAWSGPAQSMGAIKQGRAIFSMHPEDVAKIYGRLSAHDQQFFKLGAAEALRDVIAKASVTAPEIRHIGRNSYDSMMKQRLRPLFSSDKDFDGFLDAVTAERTILERTGRILGGSPTAERVSEDTDAAGASAVAHGAHAAAHLSTGNVLSSVMSFGRMMKDLGLRGDPTKTLELARLLYDKDVDFTQGPGLALLRAFPDGEKNPRSWLMRYLNVAAPPLAALAPGSVDRQQPPPVMMGAPLSQQIGHR